MNGAVGAEPSPDRTGESPGSTERPFDAHLDDSLLALDDKDRQEPQAAFADIAVLLHLLVVPPEIRESRDGAAAEEEVVAEASSERDEPSVMTSVAAEVAATADVLAPSTTSAPVEPVASAVPEASVDGAIASPVASAAPVEPTGRLAAPADVVEPIEVSAGPAEPPADAETPRLVASTATVRASAPSKKSEVIAARAELIDASCVETPAEPASDVADDSAPVQVKSFEPSSSSYRAPSSTDAPVGNEVPSSRPPTSERTAAITDMERLSDRATGIPKSVAPHITGTAKEVESQPQTPVFAAAPAVGDNVEQRARPATVAESIELPAAAARESKPSSGGQTPSDQQRDPQREAKVSQQQQLAAVPVHEGDGTPMPAFRDAVIHQVSSAGAEPPSAVPPPAVVAPHIVGVTLTPASAPPAFDITPPEIPRGPMLPETAGTIIQSLRMQFQQGGGDAVVHIRPEHLGPVSVSLRVENGSVSAVVKAENPAVAEWLQTHEDVLREGLASTGLHLERFAVRRDGQLPDDPRRNWKPPLPPERKRRMLQPQSTFEITV